MAAYGLKPVKRVDGMPYAGATRLYKIDPAGEATNLFYGQVVNIGADGYIALAPDESTAAVLVKFNPSFHRFTSDVGL